MGALRKFRRFLRRRRKAAPSRSIDFLERYREIVSDPLNLLIARHPKAGRLEDGLVYLHNGLRAHFTGKNAYFGSFSDILVINRGVHEPLEEYVFQALLRRIGPRPVMIELGAYWGHYSMWLKAERPAAEVILVEPDRAHLQAGASNFEINGMRGEFIRASVGSGQFEVDDFLRTRDMAHLDVLHADIDGHEVEMLEGAKDALARGRIDYVFISTHGNERHEKVLAALRGAGYRIEVASDCETETTSFDGLVFATSPDIDPLFSGFDVFGAEKIRGADPRRVVEYLVARSKSDGQAV